MILKSIEGKCKVEKRLKRDIHRMLRKDAQNGKSPRNSCPFETTVLIVDRSGISKVKEKERERVGGGGKGWINKNEIAG